MAKFLKVPASEVRPKDQITVAGRLYKVDLTKDVQKSPEDPLCKALYMQCQQPPENLLVITMLWADEITVQRSTK